MKIIKWAVLVVVGLVVIALGIFWFTLDRIVRSTVEAQATASLQTPTTLGGASVSPLRGKVALDDLAIANPAGFTAGHIFTLGEVSLAVSYGQLRADPIRVDAIGLKQPVITLEQKDLKTNIQALMDHLPKGEEAPASGSSQPIHLIIGELTIEAPVVVLRPGFPGLAQEIKLTLPNITMKDVGSGDGNKNGAAIKDVVMLVLTEVANKAADSDQIPAELRQLLKLDVAQMTARLKDELKVQVDKISSDLSKKLGDNLGSAVGDLIKNPKAATTNPAAIEQGLGDLFNKSAKTKGKPAR